MPLLSEINTLIKKYLKSDEFKSMCDMVRKFCNDNENIRACHCNIERGSICFFFVTKEEQWNKDTSEDITDLSFHLARKYPDEYTDLRQLPAWSWDRFIDPKESTHVWGDQLEQLK